MAQRAVLLRRPHAAVQGAAEPFLLLSLSSVSGFSRRALARVCTHNGQFCDDIQFLHPVPVGSVLEFNSHVVYAHDSHIVVQVSMRVPRPLSSPCAGGTSDSYLTVRVLRWRRSSSTQTRSSA